MAQARLHFSLTETTLAYFQTWLTRSQRSSSTTAVACARLASLAMMRRAQYSHPLLAAPRCLASWWAWTRRIRTLVMRRRASAVSYGIVTNWDDMEKIWHH